MTNDGMPKDHVEGEGVEDYGPLETRLKSKSTWLRLLFMILMWFLLGFAGTIAFVVVVLQFFYVLFTGETKKELSRVGHQLAVYVGESIEYLTYNTDERPFPFDRDWPD